MISEGQHLRLIATVTSVPLLAHRPSGVR
jgi:hypothetical protein